MTSLENEDQAPQRSTDEVGAGNTFFLVRAVVEGEKPEAMELLSHKCVHYIKSRFSRNSFPRGVEFNDFVSDVMLKIILAIESFEDRGQDSFWKWVQVVANNVWRDMWRRFHRDQKLGLLGRGVSNEGSDEHVAHSIPEAAPARQASPTQIARFHELARSEDECIRRLPENWRRVYVMRRKFELSFAEISVKVGGTNEATLRSHYARARDQIRGCLGAKIDAFGETIQGWQ